MKSQFPAVLVQDIGVHRHERHSCELLVVQPTPFCNLACKYCYLPNKDRRDVMSERTLSHVFQKVLPIAADEGITICWHAGEPLVLPVSFYERAFTLCDEIRPSHVAITHSIQTNGTLIDERWCRFFKEHGVRVGISIDGPPHIHDRYRTTRRGGGTLSRVLQGLKLLQKYGIEPGVITVLTRHSLADPDGLFRFYRDNSIRKIGFNIEETEGANQRASVKGQSQEALARSFFRRMLDLVESDEALYIREFDIDLARGLSSRIGENQQCTPLRIITVAWNGDVSTFSPELLGHNSGRYNDFVIGNICREDMAAMVQSAAFVSMSEDVYQGTELCRNICEYYAFCGGGAPSNKYFEHGTFVADETTSCRLRRKVLVDVMLDTIEAKLDYEKFGHTYGPGTSLESREVT